MPSSITDKLWAIYPIAETQVEGSEAWQLSQLLPEAVSHDGNNYVFVKSFEQPNNAIYIRAQNEGESQQDYEIFVALTCGTFLINPPANSCLILTKAQGIAFHRHPIYRLYCGRYDESDRDLFEADYNYVRDLAATLNIPMDEFNPLWPTSAAKPIMNTILQGLVL